MDKPAKINPQQLPWFAFNVQRWLYSGDRLSMTATQQGVYIEIMVAMWLAGSLPTDHIKLAKVLHGCDPRIVKKWLDQYAHLIAILDTPCTKHVFTTDLNCPKCKEAFETPRAQFVIPKMAEITEYTPEEGA